MGYNVMSLSSTAQLPAEHLDEAYKRMMALDTTHDHLKRGGSFGPGKQTVRWFSWMNDYTIECKTAQDILERLGFSCYADDETDGALHLEAYDSKIGQEDLFLESIGDLMTGEIEWQGEDGDRWKHVFGPEGMKTLRGKTIYS